MAGRKGDYLYKKADSQMWRIKLQYPDRPMVRRSLGTMDRAEAEILAMPLIEQHKRDLCIARRNPNLNRVLRVDTIRTRYPIGLSKLDDGTEVMATQLDAILIRDGVVVGRETNAIVDFLDITRTFDADAREAPAKPKPKPVNNSDLELMETYIARKTRNPYFNKECRDTWALFRSLVDNKPIAKCTRDDARLLVAHLQAKGDKRATIVKKLNYLGAPVNYAIKEDKLRFNPFSSVAPEDDDAERRLPLDDADMTAVAALLPKVENREAVLLWVLLATTGMRLSEAFQITSEQTEKGIRKVLVVEKSDQSLRWVPLPAGVLPYLPDRIEGPLFKSNAKNLGRVTGRFLVKAKVKTQGKVLHSLRHRAKDRLRAEGCSLDMQYALLGHEEKTVAAGYGRGYPMTVLKPEIDKIGLT